LKGVLLYNVLSLVNNVFNSLPCKQHLLAEKKRKNYLGWSAYGNYFDFIFDLFNHRSVAHTSVHGKINAHQACVSTTNVVAEAGLRLIKIQHLPNY